MGAVQQVNKVIVETWSKVVILRGTYFGIRAMVSDKAGVPLMILMFLTHACFWINRQTKLNRKRQRDPCTQNRPLPPARNCGVLGKQVVPVW